MSLSVSKSIEEGKWTSVHTLYFISFAIGLFIEGFLFTITSYATTWYVIPKSLSVLLLGWVFIWLIIGISVVGPISDRLGRKRTWIYTMILYAIGGIILAIAINYVIVLIAIAILVFAAGGEMNVILAMAHEAFPRKDRSKSVMLLNDFNGGVAPLVAGAIGFIAASYTVVFERYLAVLTIFIGLVALVIIRLKTPESIRWLERKISPEAAQKEKEKYFKSSNATVQNEKDTPVTPATQNQNSMAIWKRLLIIIPIGWANTAGYGLITYTLGPIYFSNVIDYIFLFTGIGAFAGGLLGIFGDRLSRKTLIFSTYWIVTVITVIVVATLGIWSHDLLIFWVFLIALNFVEQLSYATIETMKGELWPTKMRGSLTALARVLPLLLYLPVLYFATLLPLSEYLIFNIIIWVIGSLGATAWLIWGYETGKGVSIGKASGET